MRSISLCAAVNIPYNLVSSVLNHHGFVQCDNVPVLKPSHLTALIHDTYFAASKCDLFKQSVDFNLDRCTAMLANLFWNVYDPYVAQFSCCLFFPNEFPFASIEIEWHHFHCWNSSNWCWYYAIHRTWNNSLWRSSIWLPITIDALTDFVWNRL